MRTVLCAVVGWLALASVTGAQKRPMVVAPEIQEQRLVYRVPPVYPRLARQARIQGTVRMAALIDEDGAVERLKLISGHPLLVKASLDAVARWRYRPAVRRGVPVAVVTTVGVTFSFGGLPAPGSPARGAPVARVSV